MVATASRASRTEVVNYRKVRLGRGRNKLTDGCYPALIDGNGRPHAYLNAEIPTTNKKHVAKGGIPIAPLYTAICEICGKAYAHLMGSKTCACRECLQERFIIEHEEPLRQQLRDTNDAIDAAYEPQEYTASERAIAAGYRDHRVDGAYGGEHSNCTNGMTS